MLFQAITIGNNFPNSSRPVLYKCKLISNQDIIIFTKQSQTGFHDVQALDNFQQKKIKMIPIYYSSTQIQKKSFPPWGYISFSNHSSFSRASPKMTSVEKLIK